MASIRVQCEACKATASRYCCVEDALLLAHSYAGKLATCLSSAEKMPLCLQATADVLAMASLEVDLSKVEVGNTITVKWRGKPVFVRHRSEEDTKAAVDTPLSELRDPEPDEDRRTNPDVCLALTASRLCWPSVAVDAPVLRCLRAQPAHCLVAMSSTLSQAVSNHSH